jgi:D-tyrosyl-tRNA(Tyr) deacylase
MIAVIQRVNRSKVTVDNQVVGEIGKGITALVGVAQGDTDNEMRWVADKIVNLRIFYDHEGKMNLSLLDVKGELLLISQFTLLGDCRKGRRPSFGKAAPPKEAEELYQKMVSYIKERYPVKVETGVFQTHMVVEIENDGPVTFIIDSQERKA